jgi:hypothetical protein
MESLIDALESLSLSDGELKSLGIEKEVNIPMVRPTIIKLSDIEPEEVSFLWKPYIPLGKLTLLEGDPGLGKTFLALSICTAISKGHPLPGQDGRLGEAIEEGNILFMTAEDGLADTLAPRLEKMGADRSKIHCLTGWKSTEGEEEQAFTLHDINVLREALYQVKPVLVVIDPLQAYMSGIDMHRANETRPLLSNLGRAAEEYNCAILAIRHLSKGGSTKALYRGLGSIDFIAAARSALLVGIDPNNNTKVMVHTKSSCSEIGINQGFEISDISGFSWIGRSNCTAEEVLAPLTKNEQYCNNRSLDEAKEFLEDILMEGPVKCKEIKEEAKAAGISWRTVERAKENLGFKAIKVGTAWYWPQLSSDSSPSHSGVGGLGALAGKPDSVSAKGSTPTPPNEIAGAHDEDDIDLWSDIGVVVERRV